MIEKNILKDVFTCKKQIIFIFISNFLQSLCLIFSAVILGYLANEILFGKIEKIAASSLALLFFIFILKGILNYYNNRQVETISLNIQTKLRKKILEKVAHKEESQTNIGEYISLITKGVDKLDIYMTSFLPQMGNIIILPLVLLLVAFYLDYKSALIFLFTFPLIPIFMVLIGKISAKENDKQWDKFQKLSNYMLDFLPGVLVLKAFNEIDTQIKVLKKNGDEFNDATLKVLKIAFLSAFMLEFVATLSIAIIAVNIGLRLIYGSGGFFYLITILILAPLFYNPLRQFGAAFHDGKNGVLKARDIYNLIKEDKNLNTVHGELDEKKDFDIEFKNISFAYDEDVVIKDLSFKIPFGIKAVLTGPNGAGKSTIFKMLLKNLSPSTGEISIQDTNINSLDTKKYLEKIAYVPQEVYIFKASIWENITLGRDFTEEEVTDILEKLDLLPLVLDHKERLHRILEGNTSVSSGQRRRIGLARALLSKGKILLLDEPMENLDSKNEKIINDILEEYKNKVTIIIIGHRKNTLLSADIIFYIEKGKIEELTKTAVLNKIIEEKEGYNGLYY